MDSKEHNQEPVHRRHAAHALVFARNNELLWGKHAKHSDVLMIVRFDGQFGFPGGYVEENEGFHDGINREFEEEIGKDLVRFEEEELFISHDHSDNFSTHFFVKEVSRDVLKRIEQTSIEARDWGTEVLGIVRVPLYTLADNQGLPSFLKNRFVGNARDQLLTALHQKRLLPEEDLRKAVSLAGCDFEFKSLATSPGNV